MSKLEWDKTGEREFETGTSHGVLYPQDNQGRYPAGFAWNGLTAVSESPSGAESNKQYADNQVYLNLTSAEEFSGTIEAFTSPREFDQCDGSLSPVPGINVGQQTRRPFGFSYQTLIGNDIESTDYGFKVHVVYSALAAPTERSYASVNESPEALALSWEFSTTPVPIFPAISVGGRELKNTSTLTFSSLDFTKEKMQDLLDVLYGTASTPARLPSPYELITMMSTAMVETNPVAPTATELGGDTIVEIPTVAGVRYSINGTVVTDDVTIDGPTLVNAAPGLGYKFPQVIQTQWFFDKL